MRSTTSRWAARCATGVSLIALGAIAFGAPAFAADPQYGNINDKASGSITLHKHEHQSGTVTPGDPQGGTTLPNPVKDVVFTAYKLTNFNVGAAADWDRLSSLTVPADACTTPALSGWTLGAGQVLPATDSTGTTTLSLANTAPTQANAKLGAYLICETSAPATVIDKATPFVVTVPFPDQQNLAPTNSQGWLYDVHAYPKNGLAPTITKTVSAQQKLGLGSVAEYPVTTSVPRIADGNQFTSYTITDPMDPRLSSTGVKSVTLGTTALVAGTHYTVVKDRNVVMAHFTQAGLQLLKTSGGQSVTTVFTGTVTSLGSGSFANKAHLTTANAPLAAPPATPALPPLTPGDPVDPNTPFGPGVPPTTPSGTVTQNWGDLQVLKVDDGDDATPLAGAVFQVFPAADPYPANGTCTKQVPAGASAISVDGKTEFTSSATGVVSVAGLFVSDSVNPAINATSRCYVLVETAAPAGYVTPKDDLAKTAVSVKTGANAAGVYDATVKNAKNTMPALPLTGASGQVVLLTAGGALVLVALGIALIARRRSVQATESID